MKKMVSGTVSRIRRAPKLVKIVGLIGLITMVFLGSAFTFKEKEEPVITREYTVTEEKLASEVKEYLEKSLLIEEKDSQQITDGAVDAYEKILSSGVSSITDEHVRALQESIGNIMRAYITEENLSSEEIESLSAGISQIILNMLMERLEDSQVAETKEFEEEYIGLINSLQSQITELQERSYQVNISTSIDKTNQEAKLSDEDLQEIYNSINQEISDSESETKKEILEEVKTEYGDIKDGKDGEDGKDGKNGKDGVGKDGKNGKDGKDGEDGKNGKSTYIFFADDENGNNFSQSPTSDTKYMAAITTDKTPESIIQSDLSGKWEKYRDLSLTAVTDENGKTTISMILE